HRQKCALNYGSSRYGFAASSRLVTWYVNASPAAFASTWIVTSSARVISHPISSDRSSSWQRLIAAFSFAMRWSLSVSIASSLACVLAHDICDVAARRRQIDVVLGEFARRAWLATPTKPERLAESNVESRVERQAHWAQLALQAKELESVSR